MGEKYGDKLKELFDKWNDIYKNGASDPNWEDGNALHNIRNQIIWTKEEIEQKCNNFPKEYYQETPPELPMTYMANADGIRRKAKQSLKIYKKDENLIYLECHLVQLTEVEKRHISINNVIGYKEGLEIYIQEDNLLRMRTHAYHPDMYQESFARCRRNVEKILAESAEDRGMPLGQLSLFDIL